MKRLFVLVVTLFLASCQNARQESNAPVRLGLLTWIGYAPFYIAQDKGYFRANGVTVDLQRIEGDVERRAAIASGRIDGVALTLDSLVVLRSNGIPLKTIMAIDASNGGDGIVVENGITSVEQLKGKQIAFPPGLPSHFLLYSVLKQHGMKVSDITPIAMDADQAGAAFASGKIAAAVTWEPWLSRASEVGRGHVLVNSKQFPGVIEDVLFVRDEVTRSRSMEWSGVIRAWYKAVDFIGTNPAEAKPVIQKAFNFSSEQVDQLLGGIRYEGKKGNEEAFGSPDKPGFLYSLYDRISDAWVAEGVIHKRDTAPDGIDPEFVRRLQ